MIPPFDVFKVVRGEPLWVEAVPTLDAAKARVQELMRVHRCEYLILSHTTGNKISIKPNDPA